MNNWNTTRVFLKKFYWIISSIISPAYINLILEVSLVILGKNIIISKTAFRNLHELEIVVVIQKLETCCGNLRTYLTEFGNCLLELLEIDTWTA